MDAITAQLDREVARAVSAWRQAVRALRQGGPEAASNPLEHARRVSSRATFLELTGREAGIGADFGIAPSSPAAPPDALALALASWVHVLTLERVLFADRVRIAAAWHVPSIVVEGQLGEDGPGRVTPREALLALLAERSDEPRRAWAEALARGAGAIADAARIFAERREEARRRLGVEGDPPLEIPIDPPDAALRVAGALLARTAPHPEGAPTWDAAIGRAIGRDAAAGWPARLGSRWLEDLFRPTGLTEGLALDLGPLPRALGASSFARALSRFGAALAWASAPAAAPFSLAHPPFDVQRARRAALFGGLVADRVFCARALGLGRGADRDQARVTARALTLTLRLDAARLCLEAGPDGGVLLRGARARADRFEEETARALGAPIPGALAGVVPELDRGAAVRLAGALLAARDRRALVERFDEDWFRNPRAAEAIRGEDAVLPPSPRIAAADLEAGLDALVQALDAVG